MRQPFPCLVFTATLLDVLAGRRHASGISGSIYVNGILRSSKEGMNLFQSRSGYMLQLADTFSQTLTVRENLAYAAALRLGARTSEGTAYWIQRAEAPDRAATCICPCGCVCL